MKIEIHNHHYQHGCEDARILAAIDHLKETVMSAIDDLRAAVSGVETNVAEGFTALQSALEELATDIANLPANADVAAEAARLSSVASNVASATAGFATAIRDAIPTETVPNPGEGEEGGENEPEA